MNKTSTNGAARQPIRAVGIEAARRVRHAIGYEHPAELEIEVLAFMRGAIVRRAHARGSRANLLRLGDRGIIGVAEGLSLEERRWAIAHELGHFEAHADISFVGLCSSEDMVPSYRSSGREPEANAFAEELLMPADLYARSCEVELAREACSRFPVCWQPVARLAKSFSVSLAAAAIRFVSLTDEAVAVVCMREGVIAWASTSKTFGPRPRRGSRVKPWSEAYDFFTKGEIAKEPQTVSASAWIDTCDDDLHLVEHLFAKPSLSMAMSLLWWREGA